jgi:hypothetical protein
MTKFMGIALCICLVVAIGASVVGRAIDQQVQQRVLIVQNGATWDCERIVYPDGRIAHTNCVIAVP